MAISMYQASVPVFQKHLGALDAILDKAATYAEARKIDPAVLLASRLYPDMFDLKRQVQLSCDFAKGAAARLTGAPVPSHPDVEATIPELKDRLAKTLALLEAVKPAEMEGAEGREITLKVGPGDMTFSGADFLLHFELTNFFFHCATAYGILRHNGLEIGKRDFMRRLS